MSLVSVTMFRIKANTVLTLIILTLTVVHSLHLTGTFNNENFYLFLAKFGFQKADTKNLTSTIGYIYGSITAQNYNISDIDYDMYLVIVDSQYFKNFYSSRHKEGAGRCSAMFSVIDTIAWDRYCHLKGKEDFLRRVPCPPGEICVEEKGDPKAVIAGQQFTFHINDTYQPRWVNSL